MVPYDFAWHVFFDTSELFSKSRYINIPDLPTIPPQIDDFVARYVSELVVEERVAQLAEEFDTSYASIRMFQRLLDLKPRPDGQALLTHFRAEINEKLKQAGVTVFAPSSHDVNDQMAMFTARKNGDYKDMMILAGAIKFAENANLAHCAFVTGEVEKLGLFVQAAAKLNRNPQTHFTVVQRQDYKYFVSMTPQQQKALTELFTAKLQEEVRKLRRELVNKAIEAPEILRPFMFVADGPEIVQILTHTYGAPDSDLSPIETEVFGCYIVLHGGPKGEKPIKATLTTRFAIPGVAARLYWGHADGFVGRTGDGQFVNPRVERIVLNFEHPQG